MKDRELLISRYLDNDLNDQEQVELFSFLKEEKETRALLHEYMKINKEAYEVYNIQMSNTQTDSGIKKPIVKPQIAGAKAGGHTLLTRRRPAYINYMLGGIIIIIVLLSFLQVGSLRADLNDFKGKYNAALFEYRYHAERFNALIKNYKVNSFSNSSNF